jgi:hypothetical protein
MVYTANDSHEIAEIAYARHKLIKALTPEPQGLSKQALVDIGKKLWPHTYEVTNDDRTAFENLLDYADEKLRQDLTLPFEQIIIMGAVRWADCGFPQITIGHKYAAALMATHVPEDVLPLVRPPWPAFVLELPDGMLPILDDKNKEIPLRRILVQHIKSKINPNESEMKETWQYIAMADAPMSIWRHGVDTKELALSTVKGTGCWSENTFAEPVDDGVDGAANQLVGKLIVSVCLAMSDPTNVKAHASHGAVGNIGRQGREPKTRTFKLGKEITIDCRQPLDDFIHGRRKGTSPTVQTLVRGHWKPKLAERLGHPVWVSPYWRGPIDAPILTPQRIVE